MIRPRSVALVASIRERSSRDPPTPMGGRTIGAGSASPISDWVRTGPFALTFWDDRVSPFEIFQHFPSPESNNQSSDSHVPGFGQIPTPVSGRPSLCVL
jgi:hypothetical protein